jgi:hypothetical protein
MSVRPSWPRRSGSTPIPEFDTYCGVMIPPSA